MTAARNHHPRCICEDPHEPGLTTCPCIADIYGGGECEHAAARRREERDAARCPRPDGSPCGTCPDCEADAVNDAQWADGGIPPFAPERPAAKRISVGERLGWIAVGLSPFAFAAWFVGFFIWPVYFGIATLALLFLSGMYAAIFVWPYEEDAGGW